MEKKYVYHCSPNGDIEEFDPRVSTHGKAYVYATPSKHVALIFAIEEHTDYKTCESYDAENDKLYVFESVKDSLKRFYKGKSGYLYKLPAEEFQYVEGMWRAEVVSEQKVKPLEVEYIPDIYEKLMQEEKNGNVTITRYENMPEDVEKGLYERVKLGYQKSLEYEGEFRACLFLEKLKSWGYEDKIFLKLGADIKKESQEGFEVYSKLLDKIKNKQVIQQKLKDKSNER